MRSISCTLSFTLVPSLEALGIISAHFSRLLEPSVTSRRRTSHLRDFILAIMPQYEFYRVPLNAKRMSFRQLFLDCQLQLQRVQKTEFQSAPFFMPVFNNGLGIFSATDEIPEPKVLGDLIKLLLLAFIVIDQRHIAGKVGHLWSHKVHHVSHVNNNLDEFLSTLLPIILHQTRSQVHCHSR